MMFEPAWLRKEGLVRWASFPGGAALSDCTQAIFKEFKVLKPNKATNGLLCFSFPGYCLGSAIQLKGSYYQLP
jgi:hypothetical protein